jgi:hypothetical protein
LHSLEGFVTVFSLDTDLEEKAAQFDKVINRMGLEKAANKDEEGMFSR